jgi:hypothetical protein
MLAVIDGELLAGPGGPSGPAAPPIVAWVLWHAGRGHLRRTAFDDPLIAAWQSGGAPGLVPPIIRC